MVVLLSEMQFCHSQNNSKANNTNDTLCSDNLGGSVAVSDFTYITNNNP